MYHWFAVALGGALGAISRYGLGLIVIGRWGDRVPLGTWVVNGLGCFLMGILFVLTGKVNMGGPLKAFLAVGFLGALTTFSTYSLETVFMLRAHQWRGALLNSLGSVAVGLLMVAAGAGLTGWLFSLRGGV